MGPLLYRELAGLPNGGGGTPEEAPKRVPPGHSEKGWGFMACVSALHASLFGPMVSRTLASERR
jgi:hypothetical protein